MMTLRVLPGYPIPTSAVWLLTDIAEHKGRHQLFARQSPQALKALLQMALVQSAESSNRIEGVTVEPARLRPLVLGAAKPRDRSEQEIRGYRRALDLIHGKWQKLGIDVATVRRLHVLAQDGSGDAAGWKAADNEIVALQPGSRRLSASGPYRRKRRRRRWRSCASVIAPRSNRRSSRPWSPSRP